MAEAAADVRLRLKGVVHAISACCADHGVGNRADEPHVMDSGGGTGVTAAHESTVAGSTGALLKTISRNGGQEAMGARGQRSPLTTVAVTRGEVTLALVTDALTDPHTPGVIDAKEAPGIVAALQDWMATCQASRAAANLGRAIECGGGTMSQVYLTGLYADYVEAIDELPWDAA